MDNTVIAVFSVVTSLATVAIAYLTYKTGVLAERSLGITAELVAMNQRQNWFTGSMESHSALMLRIEAARGVNGKSIETLWWDPTIEKAPIKREHGKPAQLGPIYLFVPEDERQKISKA